MNKKIWKNDRDHVIHPFVQYPKFKATGSKVIASGKGAMVKDINENEYLDGIGGLWCVNIGYGRDEMVDAISDQVKALPYYNTFTDMTNTPMAMLGKKLIDLAPDNMSHVFFTTGGSMSNDTAIRTAHYYFNRQGKKKKKKIISRDNAYHGSTFLSASLTGIKSNHDGFNILSGNKSSLVHYVSSPCVYRKPSKLSEEGFCKKLVKEFKDKIEELGAENIACFIAEPIMGAGGVLVAPKGYHEKMYAICKKNDILYISDEVVTAFGRLGEMFASETLFNVKPDMICCAKGISSGYIPLGATLISKDIHKVISDENIKDRSFSHGFTYSGHPVACIAGLKNIEIIERENLCGYVRDDIGPYFESKLKELTNEAIVGDVRGKNLMMCIEFVKDKKTKESFDHSVGIGEKIANHCADKGLIARNVGDFIILSPPLIITRKQVDFTVKCLQAAIKEVTRELKV